MWWIILIIGIVIYVIYLVNKDYKADIQSNVIQSGGMQSKYKELVAYFISSSPSSKISRLTNSHITILDKNMTIYIDYVGGNTEIQVFGYYPVIGNYKNKWKYQKGYSQEKMIYEIENYFDWLLNNAENKGRNSIGIIDNYIIKRTTTVETYKQAIGTEFIDVRLNEKTGKLFMVDDEDNVCGIVASSIRSKADLISPVVSIVHAVGMEDNQDEWFPLLHNEFGY